MPLQAGTRLGPPRSSISSVRAIWALASRHEGSMRPVIQFSILLLIAVPAAARAQSPPSPDADPRIQQLVAFRVRTAPAAARYDTRRLRYARDDVRDRVDDARHRRCATMDLRRADALQREASGVVRHLPGGGAGTHHAKTSSCETSSPSCRDERPAASISAVTTTP